ncbi:Cytochrome P450 [Macleaya cordata]|uniref:Cytochrome P450 n=1 Tax=Macleaya cordata TaxID=56857 RepID=A0A200RC30_MACCD|nr:Cytochrome P450 [Macleaya cordata]
MYTVLVLKPERLRSKLRSQGIRGPPPTLLVGNLRELKKIQSTTVVDQSSHQENKNNKMIVISHDWGSTVFSCFERWRKAYGSTFLCAIGNIQVLYVTDSEMLKDIGLCTSLDLGKPSYLQRERGPLLGQGILTANGSIWAHQRKIIAPELFMDKVKGMVKLMVESAESLVKTWESKIDEWGVAEIRVDEGLRSFSADIISRACFGSSYSKGEDIFLRLRALQQVMSKQSLMLGVPGLRYLPTKNNTKIWRLEKEIRALILKVVKERMESTSEKDLLQMILEGSNNGDLTPAMADRFIVDNCKSLYFAGHETTAMSASWSLVLLASNPEWQDRVRAEVFEVCGGHRLPDIDMLRKMKLLNMVIQEALRLYPTVVFLSREVLQDMKLGQVDVPKGVNLWVPVVTLQQDPEIWGPDAHMFNPERFARGITGACKQPHVYMPFGVGTRTCVGQNLAMIELKVILSLILSKFSFSLSPKYRHSPVFNLVIEPKHGVDLLIKKL